MPDLAQPSDAFAERARRALADAHLQGALDAGTRRLHEGRSAAWDGLDDAEALREQARQIRTRTVSELDRHLADFAGTVEARGGHVAFCRTAEEANAYVVDVCRRAGARLAVKSKSMVSE